MHLRYCFLIPVTNSIDIHACTDGREENDVTG